MMWRHSFWGHSKLLNKSEKKENELKIRTDQGNCDSTARFYSLLCPHRLEA